jgi:GH25 family lysozyme M1 (1,4-beta-N-acetylmuramidase)
MVRLSRRGIGGAVALLIGVAALVGTGPDQEPLQPPAQAASYLNGVDVASYQGYPNWTSVKNSGRSFAFNKATEGTGYINPYYATNKSRIQAVGMYHGPYHFGHPSINATTQADFFVNNAGNFHGGLQLTLDLEVTDGLTPSAVWAWTQAFISRIKYRTGRPGIIYTGFYFWRDSVGNPNNNLNCPLWLAAYVSNPTPYIPQAWSGVGWAFWQYTSSGSVPGISGHVDLDYFQHGGSYPNITALLIP